MKKFRLLFMIPFIISLTSCKSGVIETTVLRQAKIINKNVNNIDNEYIEFENKLNDFLIRFSDNYNLNSTSSYAISPLSLYLALSLVDESTNSNTRNQISEALGISYDDVKEYTSKLIDNISKEYYINGKLNTALLFDNSIWLNSNLNHINYDTLDSLSNNYYCSTIKADFYNDNKKANKDLTKYVAKQTKGLINQDFDIDYDIKFLLMNTLYLKDYWFSDQNLNIDEKETEFRNLDKTITKTKLINGIYYSGKIIKTDTYESFYINTANGYSLYFIKPNDKYSAKEVLNYKNINYIFENVKESGRDEINKINYHSRVNFPKFNISTNTDLKDILINLRITDLFNFNKADFTNLTNDENIFIQRVIHSTNLNVDNKGIEGAAVTIFEGKAGSAYDEYKQIYETLEINRDFGFVLTNSRNNILFSGVIEKI